MGFREDLDAAKAAERKHGFVDVLLNGQVYLVRVEQFDPLEWAELADRAPMRPDVAIDRGYGYNIRQLTLNAIPLCSTVTGPDGSEVEFKVDPVEVKKNRVDEWAEFLRAITPSRFAALSDALFALNVWGPDREVEAARKALDASKASSS